MFGEINVELDSSKLSTYLINLIITRSNMYEDIKKLKEAYKTADWNDKVAEEVRIELNKYIDKFNDSMKLLLGIINALEQMESSCKDYENV